MIQYADGMEARIGDRVDFDGAPATVEAVLDTPAQCEDWGLAERGIMVQTAAYGLLFEPLDSSAWGAVVFRGRGPVGAMPPYRGGRITRRGLLHVAIASAGVAVVGTGGWWAWDCKCRMELTANCQSDNLSTIAHHLQEYAKGHGGRLPSADQLLAVARGEHDTYLWCGRAGLPYQWDLRMAGLSVASLGRRAVAWCPPGGHGRYVGAVVADSGELQVEGVTMDELRRLVPGNISL